MTLMPGPGNPKWHKGMIAPNAKGVGRSKIRQLIDANAEKNGWRPEAADEIELMQGLARGVAKDPHIPNTFIRVDTATREAAAKWVAEHYHGKATQSVEVDVQGTIDHSAAVDLGRLAESELGALEALLEKSFKPPALVEGEVVSEDLVLPVSSKPAKP